MVMDKVIYWAVGSLVTGVAVGGTVGFYAGKGSGRRSMVSDLLASELRATADDSVLSRLEEDLGSSADARRRDGNLRNIEVVSMPKITASGNSSSNSSKSSLLELAAQTVRAPASPTPAPTPVPAPASPTPTGIFASTPAPKSLTAADIIAALKADREAEAKRNEDEKMAATAKEAEDRASKDAFNAAVAAAVSEALKGKKAA